MLIMLLSTSSVKSITVGLTDDCAFVDLVILVACFSYSSFLFNLCFIVICLIYIVLLLIGLYTMLIMLLSTSSVKSITVCLTDDCAFVDLVILSACFSYTSFSVNLCFLAN